MQGLECNYTGQSAQGSALGGRISVRGVGKLARLLGHVIGPSLLSKPVLI